MLDKITIVDGNNWFRRRAETDTFGTPVRSCFLEIQRTPGVVICCWDGFNAKKPRKDIYPEYKAKRVSAGESIYESQRQLKELLQFSKAISITVDGYEADDVIAALTYRYKDTSPIFINSNDLDLYQLGQPMARDTFPDRPEWIKLFKSLVGDSSDNIPGCPRFGKDTWGKLNDEQKQTLEAIIVSGHGLTTEEIRTKLEPFLSASLVNKFCDKEVLTNIRLYYKIIGFIDVPMDLITKSMVVGINKPELAEPIFKQFML